MSLWPAAADVTSGATVAVTIRENSGTTFVNSVQSAVTFDATKLQYTGLTEGGTFTNVAATDSGTAGLVRVARSVQAGSAGVTGDNPIVTLNFKVLATSGAATLGINKAQSFVVESANNTDILGTVAGNTLTVVNATPSPSTLSLSPTSGTYAKDSTISVVVKATSTSKLTTVQSTLNYPIDKLQYVSTTEGGVFTTVQRTNTTAAGTVDIIRSIAGGSAGVTGTNPVVTVTFKVLSDTGSAAVTFGNTSALFDDSGTGTNILNLTASTAAVYTLTASSVTPPPPPPASGSASLFLSPATGTFAPNATVSVDVKTSSTDASVTTVQSVLSYPASQLQFVSVSNAAAFPTAQRTNTSTAGTVDLIRSISGGGTGVTGDNTVATVNFKVIGTSGAAGISFGTGSAIYDNSGTGTNILDTTTGADYTIGGTQVCSANPGTPGTPAKTDSTYTSVTLTWTASAAATNCTLAGYHIYRNGVLAGDVPSGTSFVDSGLTSGTNYSYTVTAFDTAGHTSAVSAATSVTTKADDMAPTVPTGFTAVAPNASSVNLAWNPSTDFPNPGGVGIQGYKLYRNGSSSATYTNNTATTSFTDTNVTADTTYSYTVTAYDKLGNESAPSNVVSAKTGTGAAGCTGNPTTPSGLTEQSTGLTSTGLSWTASTAANGCTLAGYRIYRDAQIVGTATQTTFSDSGLSAGTSYNYAVQAYDENGHESPLSTALTISTQSDTEKPTAPSGVTATAETSGRVTVNWGASTDNLGVTAYKVYRDGNLLLLVPGSARSYGDTTVNPNRDYSYAVSAIDAAGNESDKATATPDPVHTPNAADAQAPTTPTNLQTLIAATDTIAFGWDASTDNVGVSGYHVYRNGQFIGDTNLTTFTDLGLRPSTSYNYTVQAFDESGNESSMSATLTSQTTQVNVGLVGDLNGDGRVDLFDLSILLSHWSELNVPPRFGDINQDGKVDGSDLSTLLSHLGDTL
jgi:chitodextrinase